MELKSKFLSFKKNFYTKKYLKKKALSRIYLDYIDYLKSHTKEAIDNAVSLREIQKNQNILNTVTGAVADYLIAKKENNEPLSEAEQHLIDIAKKNVKGKESKKKK